MDYRAWARWNVLQLLQAVEGVATTGQNGFLPGRHTAANVWWLREWLLRDDTDEFITFVDFVVHLTLCPGP